MFDRARIHALFEVFGPRRVAQKVLGLQAREVQDLLSGRRNLRRRHLVIIKTYSYNRKRAVACEIERRKAEVEKECRKRADLCARTELQAEAMLAEMKRQGKG